MLDEVEAGGRQEQASGYTEKGDTRQGKAASESGGEKGFFSENHTVELTDCLPTCEPVQLLPDVLRGQVNEVSIVGFVCFVFYFGEGGFVSHYEREKVVG